MIRQERSGGDRHKDEVLCALKVFQVVYFQVYDTRSSMCIRGLHILIASLVNAPASIPGPCQLKNSVPTFIYFICVHQT